jgi:hypothetical protein
MDATGKHAMGVAQAYGLLERAGPPNGVAAASRVPDMSRHPLNDHLTPREPALVNPQGRYKTKVAHR